MFNFIRKILGIKPKTLECRRCKYLVKGRARYGKPRKNAGWFCSKKRYNKDGYSWATSICGGKKPKTTPTWCPFKQRGKGLIR